MYCTPFSNHAGCYEVEKKIANATLAKEKSVLALQISELKFGELRWAGSRNSVVCDWRNLKCNDHFRTKNGRDERPLYGSV